MRTRRPRPVARVHEGGFSLVEIAIVLAILGLLMRAALVPLASLHEDRRERSARVRVEAARDALIASVLVRGALPCPLPRSGTLGAGVAGGSSGRCTVFRGGLPAATLGLAGPVDTSGALLDPWGRAMLYALGDADAEGAGTIGVSDWTDPVELRAVGIDALAGTLVACRTAGRGPCPAHEVRAHDLVFAVLSQGADTSALDLQARNAGAFERGESVFTLAPRSVVDGHRFDDVIAWGSRAELVREMLRAGRLP